MKPVPHTQALGQLRAPSKMRQKSTTGDIPASAEPVAKLVGHTKALAEEARQRTEHFVAVVRETKKQNEYLEEPVSFSISTRDQAGVVAGIAFLILMLSSFAYLAYEGAEAWGEKDTIHIVEASI